MGATLVRAMKNFNVESRAHQLIGKDKTRAAPMHPGTKEAVAAVVSRYPEIPEKIYRKDDQLLSRLKDVYVDSTDPLHEMKHEDLSPAKEEFRAPKQTMTSVFLNIEVDNIPKGKISIVEAMTILNKHKQSPQTLTAERIAEEYCLNILDTNALLEHFRPFNVTIIQQNKEKEQIEDQ
ncbi:PREDICTED: NADH dehydrogenase [ubiquinone] 1 alpha subcomplex assembly factor 4 [Nanorana parkeri]|uniref:NADH dehydrogenase [ubiquinone] 1 alpha subcomplex assembly factor 4 n=1 Tax=Nanorana parkeri TaxID=125878 RepID=UPI0008545AB0|nr:PREDICTED: NADH dehydrogenase [ubiquinone] 1 alpha subcomplex assembly factor 4 [Nanorana parkeri]